MDEPTSALDPVSTLKIEELMNTLKEKYTVAIVTHNMQQATRISDYTAFFLVGEMVEYAPTDELFSRPVDKRTDESDIIGLSQKAFKHLGASMMI